MRVSRLYVGIIGTVLSCALPAMGQRTINHGLHAVPAPAKVVIDGDLSEWDTSGAITCTKDVTALLEVESARVSTMWDRDALYVGIIWRDASPMQNKINPHTMAGNGWRSDSIQLRSNMDGFVSHVDAWYYSDAQEPSMSISYGRMDGTPRDQQPKVDRPAFPAELGAQQVFKISQDGKGYVQEIKIPWAVLTQDGKLPRKDAMLQLGLELFWGDASAETWPRSRVTDNLADGASQTDFFWSSMNLWGKLFLEAQNKIKLPTPQWMLAKQVEPQGEVPITFTLSRDSQVTIAIEDERGNRVCSLIGAKPFGAGKHTIYWSGLDDRNKPLPVGQYQWRGIYRDAIDVQWKMSFYQPNLRTPWGNVSGTGAWGPDHGTLIAAAAGDGRVYLVGTGVEAGFALFAVDLNGNKLWTAKFCEAERIAYADGQVYAYTGEKGVNFLGLTPVGLVQLDASTGTWKDLPGPDGKPVRRLPLLAKDEKVGGFAADTNGIYLSIAGKSMVRSFDRKTFKQLREYAVPGAGELFATGDGKVLVASSKGLIELNPADAALKTLTGDDLSGARAMTADAQGNIYVALSAPRHQVAIYQRNADQARKVADMGKAGGRTLNGWYDPGEGFYNPTGVSIDSEGKLWVVEQGYKPKRVSVWKDSKWVRDFIGDTGYGGGGVINPLDPTMAFYSNMQFKIDLDKGTSVLRQIGLVVPQGTSTAGQNATDGFKVGDFDAKADDDASEYMMAYKDRAYLVKSRGAREFYRQREDGRWTLCVYIDPQKKFAWIDRNDDGQVQQDEVTRGGKNDDWGSTDYWGMRPSQNLDLFFARGIENTGLRLRVQGVTAGGTPLYDLSKFEPMAGECQNGIGLRDGSYNSGCAGERGEYFSEMRRTYPAGNSQRTFWFRGENTGRWTFRLPEPGVVLYPSQSHGVADVPSINGEVVCWVSDFGQRYLFTDDMLYVDQLFTDGRSNFDNWPDAPKPGFVANRMTPGQESFFGAFNRINDGRYILSSGFTDCRMFEVVGLNSLQRFNGQTEIKPEHLVKAEEIRRFRATGGAKAAATTIAKAKLPVTVDGKLDEWNQDSPSRITVDQDRSARIFSTFDSENLYVSWDVLDPTPMVNKGQSFQLAFKSGDAVDLMFRKPGAQLGDAAVRAGDLRLLITEIGGKQQAVLYRPVSDAKQPQVFDAFEGAGRGNAVKMDEVRLANEVKTALVRSGNGYVVEAAIPWSLLQTAPESGAEARIDFGVLFSDPSGMQTAVRSYWSNRDTNMVADIPTEALLQPGNWGTCKLGD